MQNTKCTLILRNNKVTIFKISHRLQVGCVHAETQEDGVFPISETRSQGISKKYDFYQIMQSMVSFNPFSSSSVWISHLLELWQIKQGMEGNQTDQDS